MSSSESSYPRPPLALIVTNQEWTSLSVITIFSPRGYATLRVPAGEQVLQRVRETPVDLIIVDRHLKDMTGTELAARLKEQGVLIPLVILSPEPWERQDKLAALQAGAWDACSMPMDGEELFLRVDTWVRSKLQGDVSSEQGLLDPETGMYNLQGLLRRISEIGAGAMRHRRAMACVVVEAQLTSPSAERGPMAADTLAGILREAGRASDTFGRLSQTEFVVMAPDTDVDGVRGMVERLRKAAEDTALIEHPSIRMRFGCAAVSNMREASIAPSDLLIRATEALRQEGAAADDPIQFVDVVDPRVN